MKRKLFIIALAFATTLAVADVTVSLTVPTAAVSRLQAVCNKVQADEGYSSFTNEQCLAYFLKMGLDKYAQQVARSSAEADYLSDLADIETWFPEPE